MGRALSTAWPGLAVAYWTTSTEGDRNPHVPLPEIGGKGLFTADLDRALESGVIDIAVHSLKDLPTDGPDRVRLVAIPEREDPRDVLVLRSDLQTASVSFEALPADSVIGTSSSRRSAQVRAIRSDLPVAPIRGNVETRLRKLATGEFDAVILAAAGLRRLGLEPQSASELEPEAWLPAPGQGALGVQARADDARVAKLAGRLDDRDARSAVIAERAFLSALGGGCDAPIAALARVTGGVLDLRGAVYSIDGAGTPITGTARGPASSAAALGAELAGRLASGGATRLIRRARAAGSHPPGTRSET